MSIEEKAKKKPVTLTKAQLEQSAGAELASICQSISEDGRLSNEEIKELQTWLEEHQSGELESVKFLTGLIQEILKDGAVTPEEQKELAKGIERVLPKSFRDTAKSARQKVEEEIYQRDKKLEYYDFMVAGAKRKEYQEIIEDDVNVDDKILLVREKDNSHDKNAVQIQTTSGDHIGYAPRDIARSMAKLLDQDHPYKAYVKVMLGYNARIPVVVAEFYGKEAQINDLNTPSKASSDTPKGCLTAIIGVSVFSLAIYLIF